MTTLRFDLLLDDLHAATMREASGYAAIRDAAIGVRGDRIAWIGPARDLPSHAAATKRLSCGGRWATPGMIDCHTHLVYAGNRAGEFEQRLHGASYADIARAGGGIQSTLRATRAATQDALADQSRPRLASLAAEGVTTIEIKSGYGQAEGRAATRQ
jgi:imidazolonepropionase